MARKTDENKMELARILYFSGSSQKEICERVVTTSKTLQSWMEKGHWKERRAATNLTTEELVNKALKQIGELLESGTDLNADKLSKLAAFIDKLQKKDSPVNTLEVFISFGKWLQDERVKDKDLDLEFIKKMTRYQDRYIAYKRAK